jgi:TRAP-type uncharacterized transport system substrate-binding protein
MKKFIASLFLVALSTAAFADDNGSSITIAADSSSGTYQKMLSEIIGVCSTDDFNIQQARGVTGGAPGNLDALVNNKAQAAFLHSDVYFANAQADSSYAKFQTLVALYPEPIHVIALVESKTGQNGTFSFGKAQFNSLADVRGYRVGAAGGGVYTARILQGQGEGGFTVVPYDTGDQVIAALKSGDIAAAIFVGAAPLPNITKFARGEVKILPIGESIASRVSGVYRPATINYPGITSGPLKTLAPIATLLTRKYSTPAKVLAQKHFRDCFVTHVAELQDSGSPNWQSVDANDHGVLPWYEIPVVTPTKK